MLGAPAKKRLIALHGWSATVLAILLYVVMLTGTITVLGEEIGYWSAGQTERTVPFRDGFGEIVARLAEEVPQGQRETLTISGMGPDTARLFFDGHGDGPDGPSTHIYRVVEVETATGQILSDQVGPRDAIDFSRSEDFLARFWRDMHIRLHVPGALGLYLTGIAGMAMVIAAITGVMIHRHIIQEMFVTGRPGNRLVSFRDRHNLAGVWSLPFALLLAITGTFYSFATTVALPVGAISAFNGDQDAAIAAVLRPAPPQIDAQAEMADLDAIVARAEAAAGAPVEIATIHNWGLTNAEVVTRHLESDTQLFPTQYLFDGVTGALIERVVPVGDGPSFGNALLELMAPLHFGHFAGLPSKIVWVLLGAAMTYTIVTGLQLWLRRRADDPAWQAGAHAMAVAVWGLPIALVASAYGFFLASFGDGRDAATVWSFLLAVAVCALWGVLARRRPAEDLARQMERLLGIALILLPVLRLQMGGLSWGEAIVNGAGSVLLIDVICVGLGFGCVWHARSRAPAPTAEGTAPAE
ncbi:MAG: PepSY-associated TM helix domain-containing protein [Pseudomonadota bacterium]